MQDDESRPEQTNRVTVNFPNWRRTAVAVVITALITGTSGYLVGTKTNQNASQSTQISFQPSPSPQSTIITKISPSITQQPSIPKQSPYPSITVFISPANWQVYKSTYGHQYSYPSTWRNAPARYHPEINDRDGPSSTVSAPDAKYPDGHFTVRRFAASECERYRRNLLEENNPRLNIMNQKEITIKGGYPAFQLEGKSRLDGYYYDRKSIFVVRDKTCYYLSITSRNNPEQLVILNQILSTFTFYEFETEIIKLRQKLKSFGITKEELDSL